MFKFGQIEVASKDFHKQRQITDIFTFDVNKVVLSDKMPCNNGKDWRYIVGYQVYGETIISLFIKTPKTYLAMVYHSMTRTPSTQCHLMFLRHQNLCFSIETFGGRLRRSYLKNWQQDQ